jgi:pimeloyl-ACP methyl ester carboxylesterase
LHAAATYWLARHPDRALAVLRFLFWFSVVPVTIVCGARDPVSPPRWGERLARIAGTEVGRSGGRFVVVPGAAHAVPFSHPHALGPEISRVAARA